MAFLSGRAGERRAGGAPEAPKRRHLRDRLCADIDDLAAAARRLSVNRHDPEKFHEDRGELVAGLNKLRGIVEREI